MRDDVDRKKELEKGTDYYEQPQEEGANVPPDPADATRAADGEAARPVQPPSPSITGEPDAGSRTPPAVERNDR